jgi:hypothetical protein
VLGYFESLSAAWPKPQMKWAAMNATEPSSVRIGLVLLETTGDRNARALLWLPWKNTPPMGIGGVAGMKLDANDAIGLRLC